MDQKLIVPATVVALAMAHQARSSSDTPELNSDFVVSLPDADDPNAYDAAIGLISVTKRMPRPPIDKGCQEHRSAEAPRSLRGESQTRRDGT